MAATTSASYRHLLIYSLLVAALSGFTSANQYEYGQKSAQNRNVASAPQNGSPPAMMALTNLLQNALLMQPESTIGGLAGQAYNIPLDSALLSTIQAIEPVVTRTADFFREGHLQRVANQMGGRYNHLVSNPLLARKTPSHEALEQVRSLLPMIPAMTAPVVHAAVGYPQAARAINSGIEGAQKALQSLLEREDVALHAAAIAEAVRAELLPELPSELTDSAQQLTRALQDQIISYAMDAMMMKP